MKTLSTSIQAFIYIAILTLLTIATLYWAKLTLDDNIQYLSIGENSEPTEPVKM